MAKPQSVWPVIVLMVLAVGMWIKEQYVPARDGRWERIEGCRWVPRDRNDGDSFFVRFPDGKVEELRLYFVDAPESARKTYRGGKNNHKRIRQQADELGVTEAQAVEIGVEAKKQVEAWLSGNEFTVVTLWDDPFGDRRYSALIEMPDGPHRWLHEALVAEGLVRIHTKGTDLPNGTPLKEQEKKLKALEETAKRDGAGAWRM